MSYGFSRDHSLDLLQTSNPLADTDTGVNPFSAIGRGIGAGISLAPQIAADIFEPSALDSDLDRAAQSPMSMVLDPLRKSISDIAKGAAENAEAYRQRQLDAMTQSGEVANVAYGVSYGLSAFVGGGLNPASMGYGLGRARYQQEIAAGVDDATAQYIGAIEGTVGAVGAAIPFIGKNLVQRLGFGVAANVIPGMAQRGAEANVFGTKYADRAPEVFDPVAIAVDTVLGAGFGYLAGATPEKPKLITEDDINDALEQNANLRNADNSPGFPDDPESFGLHNDMISEVTSAINEGRGADLRQILDANLKDSPEQIANLEQALADISDNSAAIDKPVFDRISKDLTDAGIYTPEQSKYLSRVASMGYSSMAKRMGRNVDDLYDEFPLDSVISAMDTLPVDKGIPGADEIIVRLISEPDPSMFVKNLGSDLFGTLGKLAESPDAPKQIIDDFNTLTKRGGMTPEQWRKSTIDERRAAHEAVAEDFEAYLMTGEAPSIELNNAFSLIKDWMLGVYKSMRGEVQPDVAKVFDRILATDEQMAMRHTIVDYAAVAKRTDTIAKSNVDDLLDEAMEGVDLDGTVILDGKEVLVRDLIADDPSVEEEAGAIKKLLGCMLNVR